MSPEHGGKHRPSLREIADYIPSLSRRFLEDLYTRGCLPPNRGPGRRSIPRAMEKTNSENPGEGQEEFSPKEKKEERRRQNQALFQHSSSSKKTR